MLYTTLQLLRSHDACSSGLSTLIASLPENHPDTEQIPLDHILKSNGLEHAIWALRATTVDSRKIAARMVIDFARGVLDKFEKQFPEDKRPRTALDQAEAFLDGKITLAEVESAALAARAATWAAQRAATWAAAWAAAWAAEAAAWAAAESAAESAARSVAWANEAIFRKWIA